MIVIVFPAYCFPTFTVTAVFPVGDLTAETLGFVAALEGATPTELKDEIASESVTTLTNALNVLLFLIAPIDILFPFR